MNLKNKLKIMRVTQQEFAEFCDVSVRTINYHFNRFDSTHEKGDENLMPKYIKMFADLFFKEHSREQM